MIANLQDPIATIRGVLGLGSDYYARMLRGKCVIQHKPNRSGHQDTPAQIAARKLFGTVFGTNRKGTKNAKNSHKTGTDLNITTTLPSSPSLIP